METPKDNHKLFAEMIQKIRQKIHLNAVILFGYRAKGSAKFYSDFDLVVIGDFTLPYLERVKWVLWLTPPIPVDLFCYTSAEFDKLFHSYHLTAIDAIGEGVVLFEENFVTPYKIQYENFVKHGMRKTECTLIPPSL